MLDATPFPEPLTHMVIDYLTERTPARLMDDDNQDKLNIKNDAATTTDFKESKILEEDILDVEPSEEEFSLYCDILGLQRSPFSLLFFSYTHTHQ